MTTTYESMSTAEVAQGAVDACDRMLAHLKAFEQLLAEAGLIPAAECPNCHGTGRVSARHAADENAEAAGTALNSAREDFTPEVKGPEPRHAVDEHRSLGPQADAALSAFLTLPSRALADAEQRADRAEAERDRHRGVIGDARGLLLDAGIREQDVLAGIRRLAEGAEQVRLERVELERMYLKAMSDLGAAFNTLDRVRAALASFDGRGVLGIGNTSIDIPRVSEVIDAVRRALAQPQPQEDV